MNVNSYLAYLRGALMAALLTGLAFGLIFAFAFFLGVDLEGDLTLDLELGGLDGLWFLVLAPLAFALVFLVRFACSLSFRPERKKTSPSDRTATTAFVSLRSTPTGCNPLGSLTSSVTHTRP